MSDSGAILTNGMLDMMINNKEMQCIMSKTLPAVMSIQLAKLVRKCNEELTEYIDKKQEIFKEYSKKDDQGNPIMQSGGAITIAKEHIKQASQELDEIAAEYIDEDFKLPTFTFKADSFPDITPQEALVLLPFIKES